MNMSCHGLLNLLNETKSRPSTAPVNKLIQKMKKKLPPNMHHEIGRRAILLSQVEQIKKNFETLKSKETKCRNAKVKAYLEHVLGQPTELKSVLKNDEQVNTFVSEVRKLVDLLIQFLTESVKNSVSTARFLDRQIKEIRTEYQNKKVLLHRVNQIVDDTLAIKGIKPTSQMPKRKQEILEEIFGNFPRFPCPTSTRGIIPFASWNRASRPRSALPGRAMPSLAERGMIGPWHWVPVRSYGWRDQVPRHDPLPPEMQNLVRRQVGW